MHNRVEAEPLLNWSGNVAYAAQRLHHPRTVAELQEVVAGAPRIRALGSRHSFSTVADTDGELVSTLDLDLRLHLDSDAAVAEVPGGWTFAQVTHALEDQGWALHNLGSLPHISVAGACSTGTHGSGSGNGCLASAVVRAELVLADGTLLEVDRDDPRFGGVVLSLGSLGVVTRLWLRVEPTYRVTQDAVRDVPLATVAADPLSVLDAAYSVSMFLTFRDPEVVDSIVFKQRIGGEPGLVPDHLAWGGRMALEAVHPIPGLDTASVTAQLGSVGAWHERLPHFRREFTPSSGDEIQSEYFVPRDRAGAVVEALQRLSPRFRDALQVCELRSVAADDMWLSPFLERDSVAVHATWLPDPDVHLPALAAFEEAVEGHDARPHWGKVFLAYDAARVAQCFPGLPRFRSLAEELDPQGCFANDFTTALGVR